MLLCASHNDLGLVLALKKLGYYIICTGNIKGLPGERYVDEYIQADYSDKDLVLNIAKEKRIDAICQCCNDFGVYTAAYVAEQLNLPGYDSYETTLILHNKDRFNEFAKKHGIRTPESRSFCDRESALQWIGKGVTYPLIMKPVDASAGNGISKVETEVEATREIENAFSKSKEGRIVIEPFISGSQHGLCTFLRNQKVIACCSNNEYSIVNPYRVEIDTYPSENFDEVSEDLRKQIEHIAAVLELKDGIFHLQYIMDEKTPMIIEVMRRVLGNMYSVPANLLNGIDWDYWETRAKCGLSCDGFPQKVQQEGFYAYKTILAKENGVIDRVEIPQKYHKFLLKEYRLKHRGERIHDFRREPIGFLFFIFSSYEEMKQILITEYEDSLVRMGEYNECKE